MGWFELDLRSLALMRVLLAGLLLLDISIKLFQATEFYSRNGWYCLFLGILPAPVSWEQFTGDNARFMSKTWSIFWFTDGVWLVR